MVHAKRQIIAPALQDMVDWTVLSTLVMVLTLETLLFVADMERVKMLITVYAVQAFHSIQTVEEPSVTILSMMMQQCVAEKVDVSD